MRHRVEMSLDFAVEGKPELARDARFDMDGFKNALKLRAELVGGDANAVRPIREALGKVAQDQALRINPLDH